MYCCRSEMWRFVYRDSFSFYFIEFLKQMLQEFKKVEDKCSCGMYKMTYYNNIYADMYIHDSLTTITIPLVNLCKIFLIICFRISRKLEGMFLRSHRHIIVCNRLKIHLHQRMYSIEIHLIHRILD